MKVSIRKALKEFILLDMREFIPQLILVFTHRVGKEYSQLDIPLDIPELIPVHIL